MGVKHWSEADYYRASRRARAAWEAEVATYGLCWCGASRRMVQESILHANGHMETVGRLVCRGEHTHDQNGLEGADAGTTSLVASAPSSPNDGLAAAEREGVLETVRTVGLPCSAAASPPSPHADAARTSGSHSSGRGEGGLDNPTTRET